MKLPKIHQDLSFKLNFQILIRNIKSEILMIFIIIINTITIIIIILGGGGRSMFSRSVTFMVYILH